MKVNQTLKQQILLQSVSLPLFPLNIRVTALLIPLHNSSLWGILQCKVLMVDALPVSEGNGPYLKSIRNLGIEKIWKAVDI